MNSSMIENRLLEYKKLQYDIDNLNKLIEVKQIELKKISSDKIVVRFGDLLLELANMYDINVDDIYVKMDTGISFRGFSSVIDISSIFSNIEDYKNLITNKPIISVDICSKDKKFNFCSLICPFNFDTIQNDGIPMYEHLSVETRSDKKENIYSLLVVNKNISDIILEIPMDKLWTSSRCNWYPATVFASALMSCGEISIESTDKNVRSRVKK